MTFINVPAGHVAAADCARVQALLAANPLLSGAPEAALAELAQHARLRSHGDGQTLFFEGDAASHCLLVESGAVEVLRFAACGDERMLHRFGAGDLVAEAAMFMPHGLYPMTARAAGPTRVWRLPRTAVRAACERHPALALRLLEVLSLRLYRRVNEVDWLTRSNTPQRLATYVLALAGSQGERIELPTSQRQLAARLGVRAETLSRLLAQWQARGWIRGESRSWRLCDSNALRRLVPPGADPF
ncbi:Crp/Fnr family transcriptional regulator [Alicycliphilus denitrificans]|uniref:Crp/Fnr family transcriptional regulator n=1 Tax=Alicycliphilus denitrificans TaxID=179636 RepID=UPI003A80F525